MPSLIRLAAFPRCIVKITGDMTLSFPMGIIKVFTNNPSPAVLTFKLKNTSRLEQILPNQQLVYRWDVTPQTAWTLRITSEVEICRADELITCHGRG